MPMHPKAKHLWYPVLALAMSLAAPMQSHAIDPKFELDPGTLSQKFGTSPSPAASKQESKVAAKQEPKGAAKEAKSAAKEPKDAGKQASRVAARHESRGATAHGKLSHAAKAARARTASARAAKSAQGAPRVPAADYQVKLARIAQGGEAEAVESARQVWTRLVPAGAGRVNDRFDYHSDAFSLALDPERYPTLTAQDGGTILVDGAGTLPPLVKALIQEKNPQLRIVSEDAANRQRFYRSLLTAAQFFSFEEDFSVDFGTDPKITVRSDFKIEKTPDSLERQDVTLLNVSENRRATPDGLVRLLNGSGFRLVEAGTPAYQVPPAGPGDLLYQVTDKEPKKILDSFLDALAVPFETGKNIDLYAKENIGVRLDVPVDRYFEDNGQRYVVAQFNGDPVTYTLVRLLETKGYRVIMLQAGDDFHSVADKVLSRLRIPGRYGEYDLWSARNVGYGVRMSGAMIRDSRNGDRNLFVTDRHLDPLVQELADLNGYHLLGSR